MKYTLKFYSEKRSKMINGIKTPITLNVPLIMSVSFDNNQMLYFTGKRCNIAQWKTEDQCLTKNVTLPNGQSRQDFHSDLNKLRWIVDELFKSYSFASILPSVHQLRDDLKTNIDKEDIEIQKPEVLSFFDCFKKYVEDSPVTPGRKKQLNKTRNKLLKFNPDTTFEIVNSQYLSDFRTFLLDKEKGNLSKNTVSCELRRMRAFYGYANKFEWTTNYPFKNFTIDTEVYGDPIFITTEERDFLFNAEISNPRLAYIRDIFIFQCFIGCRVEDLMSFKRESIIDNCIEYIAGKTVDNKPRTIRVPLTKKAKTIIARYNLPNGDLLPFLSKEKYNKYLKELFKDQEINRMVTKLDPKTRKYIQVPICDIVSSHMARRVFIGGLHHAGAKDSIIASMSGHAEHSRAFSRYYNIGKEDQQSAISLIE